MKTKIVHHVESERVTLEHRHEIKSCSACHKDQQTKTQTQTKTQSQTQLVPSFCQKHLTFFLIIHRQSVQQDVDMSNYMQVTMVITTTLFIIHTLCMGVIFPNSLWKVGI